VLIYPEQSMWWNYRKPKPLKSGGFYFAAKNKVPVLPCFITMRDSSVIGADGFPVQEYTIHVEKPIYPDPTLSVSENSQMMMDKNYEIWKEIYEREYGIELKYETRDEA
jgi:1-acyl-sn-glycerol-3-phosphate acyltransferase